MIKKISLNKNPLKNSTTKYFGSFMINDKIFNVDISIIDELIKMTSNDIVLTEEIKEEILNLIEFN